MRARARARACSWRTMRAPSTSIAALSASGVQVASCACAASLSGCASRHTVRLSGPRCRTSSRTCARAATPVAASQAGAPAMLRHRPPPGARLRQRPPAPICSDGPGLVRGGARAAWPHAEPPPQARCMAHGRALGQCRGWGRAVNGGLNTLRCTMGSANAAGACTTRSDSDTGPAPCAPCAPAGSPYACACAARPSASRHAGAACAARGAGGPQALRWDSE